VDEGLPDGAELACGHCGLLLRNGPALRAFRWAAVDPRRGSRLLGLWGGAIGAFLWIPVVGVVLALHHRFDAVLLGTLSLPYLGLPPLLEARARTPAVTWLGKLWIGVGLYMLYVAAVLVVVPRWNALLAANGLREPPAFLVAFGAVSLVAGTGLVWLYRRRVARAPRYYGPPPG
jgi:hypothetical protein